MVFLHKFHKLRQSNLTNSIDHWYRIIPSKSSMFLYLPPLSCFFKVFPGYLRFRVFLSSTRGLLIPLLLSCSAWKSLTKLPMSDLLVILDLYMRILRSMACLSSFSLLFSCLSLSKAILYSCSFLSYCYLIFSTYSLFWISRCDWSLETLSSYSIILSLNCLLSICSLHTLSL